MIWAGFFPRNVLFTYGWDGMDVWDGVDGVGKMAFIVFILRFIKHYTHIYLNIHKSSPHKFRMGLIFDQVGDPNAKNQKHPLGRVFFKSY